MQNHFKESFSSAGDYLYAYNGMETDHEVSGHGNSYTTQFRQYDPRLGRWKSLDPLAHMLINKSPYEGLGNNPSIYSDGDGDIVRIKNMPRKLRKELVADLRSRTGLDITMNMWGKLIVPPGTPVPQSTDLAAYDLYQMILDPNRTFIVSEPSRYNFWHPWNTVTDEHQMIPSPGNVPNPSLDPDWADAPGASYEIFISQDQLNRTTISDPGDVNLKTTTSVGAIFFHEAGGHGKRGLIDEPTAFPASYYNSQVAPGNAAGNVAANLAGSAANYENMLFQSIGCPMLRRNYTVLLGEYAYVFYSEHSLSSNAPTQINTVITDYNNGLRNHDNIVVGTQLSYLRVWVPRLAMIERAKDFAPKTTVSSKQYKKISKKVESHKPRYD